MAPNIGTYDISMLLDTRFNSVSVIEFGMDSLVEVVNRDLTAHNAIVNEMVTMLADPTQDRNRIYGTGAVGEMAEVDEYGRTETQVTTTGATVAFPLRLFQYAVGWTRKYMERATVRDIAVQTSAAQQAHMKRIRYDVKRAIFLSANYTYTDHLIDRVALGVKRLVNADSATIPNSPDGSTFDGATHTHYDANATLTTTFLTDSISDLLEHGHGGKVMVAVHYSNAAAFVALTGFVAAQPTYIQNFATTVTVPTARTDLGNQYDRLLGYYGAAEVWVKPWAIANYFFLWDAADPIRPLVFRQRGGGIQGLQLAAELDGYPLYAKFFEAEYGFGVWNRTNGVVGRFNDASYANPTITQ